MPRCQRRKIGQALHFVTRNCGRISEWEQRGDVSWHPTARGVVVAPAPVPDKAFGGDDFNYERRLAHVGCGRRSL